MSGTLHDTYVAALQHDLADLPAGVRRVGVVRKPTSWFHGVVEENYQELGPPTAVLDEFQDQVEAYKLDGMCDEGAHNAAWEELDFADRYREYLTSDAAQTVMDELLKRLDSGTDVALVCYENTDSKRCHRTILREELADQRGE